MSTSKYLLSILVLVFGMMLPSLAVADDGTDFSNSGGTLSGTNAGLSLTGSMLIAATGYNGGGLVTGDLGSVTFSTGAINNGSLQKGGTFAAGGRFTVNGNGNGGLANGVLFTGQFTGPVTWTLTTLANGTHNYTLTGVVTGMMGGSNVNGVSVQLTVNTGKGYFGGSTTVSGGDTTFMASVPESSTLTLFGTGVLSLAGIFRRKLMVQ
jgi:hypothetical protein